VTNAQARRRRRRRLGRLLPLLALVVVFVVGVAVGEALHDNPRPGGGQTIVRTLKPLALLPTATTNHTTTTSTP